MVEIDVLHRYGAPRHYEPLTHISENNTEYGVQFYEFTFISNLSKAIQNLRFLSQSVFTPPGDAIVLGAEPYDVRIPLFQKIADDIPVIYHTSWPYWGENVPREPLFDWQVSRWRGFLGDVNIVTVTEKAKTELESHGFSAKRIPHAVDTELFTPKGSNAQWENQTTVLFVGRLEERKGIRDLLEVIKSTELNITFRFVGEGPLSPEVTSMSSRYPVIYDGYVSDTAKLAEIYKSSDVFVLPSHRTKSWEELFGIVLIEAMACGLPLISTDCVGPAEIIDDGETGFLVGRRNPNELKEKIELLVTNARLRNEMGRRARSVAVEKYDINTVAKQWKQVVENVMGS